MTTVERSQHHDGHFGWLSLSLTEDLFQLLTDTVEYLPDGIELSEVLTTILHYGLHNELVTAAITLVALDPQAEQDPHAVALISRATQLAQDAPPF